MPPKSANKLTKESNKAAWLAARRKGLGGTDMAAIMGVSPWATALDVYNEKLGSAQPDEQSKPMRRGEVLEAVAADEYMFLNPGVKLQRGHAGMPVGILQHPDLPFMRANIDRVFIPADLRTIAEIKCPGLQVFAKVRSKGVPQNYIVQGQHYLTVTGYERVIFIFFSAERWEFITVSMDRDEEVIETILNEGREFWEHHILQQIPPTPPQEPLIKLPEVSSGEILHTLDPHWTAAAQFLSDAKDIKAELTAIMKAADADVMEGAGLRIYNRQQKGRESFDKKRFAAEHPDLIGNFLKQGKPFRTFKAYFLGGAA